MAVIERLLLCLVNEILPSGCNKDSEVAALHGDRYTQV